MAGAGSGRRSHCRLKGRTRTVAKDGLRVTPGLRLPHDAVTQSFALLAVRRAGKSNAAAVLAEEMHAAGLPWVAVDPKGDWWGLRSSKDGTGPGLPVPVFGGLHGDMPLTPGAGNLLAELIAEENLTCILDVSDFPSKSAQSRFLTDFAEHLFRLHRKHPRPRHIFLEEADDYLPQRVMQNQARCVGAWTRLVKQGGAFGLGVTLISQRSAVVNKDALTQIETLIALRTTSPQDRSAIKAWVDYHDAGRELVDSLPGLEDGEAWVCSPHWLARHGQPAIQRVRFRQRSTFDSGATPTMTSAAQRPATLADIDIGAISARMEAVAEQAADNDPVILRKRIAALEHSLGTAKKHGNHNDGTEAAALRQQVRDLSAEVDRLRARPPERVEVPVVSPGEVAAVEQVITGLRDIAGNLELSLGRAAQSAATAVPAAAAVPPPAVQRTAETETGTPPVIVQDPGAAALGKAQRAILTVLAQFPEGRTRAQVATLSGYSVKSSGLANALGALRSAGLVNRGNPIQITPEGVAMLGDSWEPLPSGAALVNHWMSRLGKAERALLRVFIEAWPEPLTKEAAAERAGYSPSSSGLANALGRLRTLELVRGWIADDTLAREARAARA